MELSIYAFCMGVHPAAYRRKYGHMEDLKRSDSDREAYRKYFRIIESSEVSLE